MLFSLLYGLPLWASLSKNNRTIRIIVLGLIFYIIVHFFITSHTYRKYAYYASGLDSVIYLVLYLYSVDKKENTLTDTSNQNNQITGMNNQINNELLYNNMNNELLYLDNELKNEYEKVPSVDLPVYKHISNNADLNVSEVESNIDVNFPIYKHKKQ